MTSVSVVQYGNSSSPSKVNVLQQTTDTGNKREVIVLRKPPPHILPQPKDYRKDDIILTNTAKKKPKPASKEANKTSPQPVAVARRNARERNRVKQVNNGFANLRQHIPNFIAAAFESNSGRGGNKKLSKVETLRMAVEYIRSLEDILAMSANGETTEGTSVCSYPSPSSSSPSLTQSNLSYNYPLLSPSLDEDDISSTPSPQQYIRINTSTNTYQIIPGTMYENSENLDPMVDDHIILSDPALVDANLEFIGQDLSYLNNIQTSASLSPGMYSDQSLSPSSLEKSDPNCFIPVFNTSPQDIKMRLTPPSNSKAVGIDELPVISLKTENELPAEHKDNVIDVIQWWEQQQPPQSARS